MWISPSGEHEHGCIPGDRFSIVARDAWIEIITLSAKPVIAHLIFRRSYLRTSIYINRVVAHFVSFCFYQLVGRITWRDRLTRNFKKDADTIGDRHRDKLPFATANIFDWTGQLKFIESPSRSLPKFAQSMRIIDAPFFSSETIETSLPVSISSNKWRGRNETKITPCSRSILISGFNDANCFSA